MSLTRFHDDPNRIKKTNLEASAILDYKFNVPSNFNNNNIYISDPHLRLQHCGSTQLRDMVGVESELRQMDTPLQRDYIKNQYKKSDKTHGKVPIYQVKKAVTDESRTTHPAWTYRINSQFRPEHLFEDPQKNAIMNFDANLDTNINTKDNYRKNDKKI